MTERMTDERLARYEHEILEGRYGEDDDLDELLAECRRARACEKAARKLLAAEKEYFDAAKQECDALRDQLKRYGHTPEVVK